MKKEKEIRRKVIKLAFLLFCLFVTYMTIENQENWSYILPLRGNRLLAFMIVGVCTTISAITFQTVTQNRLLTPNVVGLDSLYVLFQSMVLFILGSQHGFIVNSQLNFFFSTVLMVSVSVGLFWLYFKKFPNQLFLLLMLGMILGTFFRSTATFFQVLMDPNEFTNLQSSLFASFNNVDTNLLLITGFVCVGILVLLFKYANVMDVLALGHDQALMLGVDVQLVTLLLLISISILTALSTALVGPVTFLGFVTANLTYRLFPTYRHKVLFIGGSLLGIIILMGGQLAVERVFRFQTPLRVVIEFSGGCYFLYVLLRERKRGTG